jgi:hypothetical protein
MQSFSPPPTYFSLLIPKEYSALHKERFACSEKGGLLTNMANTCPGFSETGSLSNIRFPLSHENDWNFQALGTDTLGHTNVVTMERRTLLSNYFSTWQD